MQKWEYKISHRMLDEGDLNDLGADGWELVVYNYENDYFIFKRRKP